MTATARFLHQLRHDFMAARLVLIVLWALLALSIPGLWLQWRARDVLMEGTHFFREADLISSWAALFAAFGLAFLIEKITPHDAEAFYHSRPNRNGLLLGSVTALFLICVLLPVLLQQTILCWMAVGSAPLTDMLLRLATCLLPYAMSFAFVFIVGTTVRLRGVLLLIVLLLLYYTRYSSLFLESDDPFAALAFNVRQHLNQPFSISYYRWPSRLPHPSLRIAHDLALLGIAFVVSVVAWRWRWRAVPVVVFFLGVAMSHRYFTKKADQDPRWLPAAREKADALGPVSVTAAGVHLLTTGPPAGGFELKFLPGVRDLPPSYTATVGLLDATLRSPGNWNISSSGGWPYSGPSQETNLNRTARLAPSFAESLFGCPVTSLSPKNRDSMDNPDTDRDPKPANMAVFMHKDAEPASVGRARPVTANWFQPVSAEADFALPVNHCRIIARLPLRAGVRWHEGSQEIRIAAVTPLFKTIRTDAGAGVQWQGCRLAFWKSSLLFDHDDPHRSNPDLLGGIWIPVIYHPKRHEMLGDLKAQNNGRIFAGTSVSMGQYLETFKLEDSRIGSLDEHWLDEAELVLIESDFVGTLKRHLDLENLQPVKQP